MNIYIAIILTVFTVTTTIAQKDSLILYTKANCGHCIHTKKEFDTHGIYYTNRPLEDAVNGKEMLTIVKGKKYSGTIYLPVILLNDSLVHPIYPQNDSIASLSSVIKEIITKRDSGIYVFPYGKPTATALQEEDALGDCEAVTEIHYVFCDNFKDAASAEKFKAELIEKGYKHAGILIHNKYFRVYPDFFFTKEDADKFLSKIRKKYPKSYYMLSAE